jgi:tRNA U55 pseudouridine synthase TruB
MLEACLEPFRGDILQIPPMYSALKHNGKRLHKLARAGKVCTIYKIYIIILYTTIIRTHLIIGQVLEVLSKH